MQLIDHWQVSHPPESVALPDFRPLPPPRGRRPTDPMKHLRPADEIAALVGVESGLLDEWLCAGVVDGTWDATYGWWTSGLSVQRYLAAQNRSAPVTAATAPPL